MPQNEDDACSAVQPIGLDDEDAGLMPYMCDRYPGHEGPHSATINGQTIAEWMIAA